MNKLKKKVTLLPGFTLIELLIVIVIIGILAGVLLTVIDPAKQQTKAKEAALRANVEKGCLALHACGSTTSDALACVDMATIGIKDPSGTPTSSVYRVVEVAPTLAAPLPPAVAPNNTDDTVYFVGNLGTCSFYCNYNFTTDSATMLTKGPTTCLIADQ